MEKKELIRNIFMSALIILISVLGNVFREIDNYLFLIVWAVFAQSGIRSIIDYIFDLPMSLGVYSSRDHKKETVGTRRLILIGSISMTVFGVWWYFNMPI